MNNCYKSHNHSKHRIRYHIILSVKYHKKILAPIIEDLKKSMQRAVSMTNYWKVDAVETDVKEGKDHHVHVLVKATPQIAPFEIVHKLKQVTTYDMWKQHSAYLQQFFWSGQHHLWTRGYFCSTIGEVSEQTLRKYIENQG